VNRLTFLKSITLGIAGIFASKEVIQADKLELEQNEIVSYLNQDGDTYEIDDIEWQVTEVQGVEHKLTDDDIIECKVSGGEVKSKPLRLTTYADIVEPDVLKELIMEDWLR